ncbi:MAG: sugar phosphate isomerase/epimerase [Burkholderiales bacterium]|nr:sugar phosphate isomerase/epimerase [Burkholderiales bacterium]
MRDLTGRLDLCCINTATLGHREPIERIAERVARAGFGFVTPWRHEIDEKRPQAAAAAIRAAGLKLGGYCRTTYFSADDAAGRREAIADNQRAIEVAAELGAPFLVAVVGGLAPHSSDAVAGRGHILDGIAALRPTLRACGVRLALEPLHPFYAADRSLLSTLAQAVDWCEQLDDGGPPCIGIALDAYHVWWDPALSASIARAGPHLLALHVCDWLRTTRDPLLDRGMMGDGVIDLRALRAAAEATGFAGPVEVEIFSQADWWTRDPDDVLATCSERLQRFC